MPQSPSSRNDDICTDCGNPVSVSAALCPYCGAVGRAELARVDFVELDIGHGNMTWKEASETLNVLLVDARSAAIPILLVIHGYGSSGQGGSIRQHVRKLCRTLQSEGSIAGWMRGEDFGASSGWAAELVKRYPGLRKTPHWNAANPGITLISLRG